LSKISVTVKKALPLQPSISLVQNCNMIKHGYLQQNKIIMIQSDIQNASRTKIS